MSETGGFEVPSKVANLTFEQYPELVVKASSIPLGEYLDLVEAADRLKAGQETSQDVRSMFEAFAARLSEWNCTRLGEPIPTTLAGLYSMELGFAMDIVLGWFAGMSQVSGPLDEKSTPGSPQLESTLPMVIG